MRFAVAGLARDAAGRRLRAGPRVERRSPGLVDVVRLLPRTLAKRRAIMARRDRAALARRVVHDESSRSSARAASPPTTAASRPSPRSWRRAWSRAGTTSPSTAGRSTSIRRAASSRASACSRRRPSATSTSTRSSTPPRRRCTRSAGGYDAVLVCNAANAIFCGLAAPGRHARRAQRRRHRAQAEEMERPGTGLVPGLGVAGDVAARTPSSPTPRSSRPTTASATGPRRRSSPTAVTSAATPARATLERFGLEAQPVHPLRQPPGARKQRARGDRGLSADEPRTETGGCR